MTKRKSKSWLERHKKDRFVQASQKDGYRSRASYKLLELQKKYRLIKSGMKVIDIGAAPGGWSQVVSPILGKSGKLWALDLLSMDPIPNVSIIQGDFTSDEVQKQLTDSLNNERVDWVISDIAPNLSGCRSVDQPKIIDLLEHVWDFAAKHLKPSGGLLVKVFQGSGLDEYVACLKKHFKTVHLKKPESSRAESRELYVLARGYNI